MVTPCPVISVGSRCVHAAGTIQPENVLNRKENVPGNGAHCETNKIPVDIASVAVHKTPDFILRPGRGLEIPAPGGVIVMSACIADTVFNVMIGQIVIVMNIIKGKLENTHSRKSVSIPELFNGGGNDTKVFGDNRQSVSKGLYHMVEEICSGAFFPLTIDGSFFTVGNGPEGFKSPEMVDAEHICDTELMADTADPPLITVLFMGGPVIEGLPQSWPVALK